MLTAADVTDARLQPAPFWAKTRNRYDVAGVRPFHVRVVTKGRTVDGYTLSGHVAPPSMDASIRYRITGDPPLSAGGVHATSMDVDVAFEPTTPVGTPGRVVARTAVEGADHGL